VRRADQKALVLGHDKLQELSGLWAIDADQSDDAVTPLAANAVDGDVWRLLPWPAEEAEKSPPEKSGPEEKTESDPP
jgi:hypothetical protein